MITKGSRSAKVRTTKQTELGQFFTPQIIADYMASLFNEPVNCKPIILDPGAGEGILGNTLIKRLSKSKDVVAKFVELDQETCIRLELTSQKISSGYGCIIDVCKGSFIDYAKNWHSHGQKFSHIIMNPPYFKLNVKSDISDQLREQDVVVSNMYSAFVWLSVKLLADNGELVAIIPRSFCNGPYFSKFRNYILSNSSIEKIHIFRSRDKAFSGDGVLQENIIIHLKKAIQSPDIKIVCSSDQTFSDNIEFSIDSNKVISQDAERIIHIPDTADTSDSHVLFKFELQELGISVSTGPIVDFRLREKIFVSPEPLDLPYIPLIYPINMRNMGVQWPAAGNQKKGQYFLVDDESRRWITPLKGYHVIVRRFSSKEEKRRIFASVVDPGLFSEDYIAYENHINYFHIKKEGLDKQLALGLCAFLNSQIVDKYFRTFSGHTQVNVSDLKRLKYPSVEYLRDLGTRLKPNDLLDESTINKLLENQI